jgi:hypothetical protein
MGGWCYREITLVFWKTNDSVYCLIEKHDGAVSVLSIYPTMMKLIPEEMIQTHFRLPALPPSKELFAFDKEPAPFVVPNGTFLNILGQFFDYEEQDLLGL